jgi:hypothetical protein
MHAAIFAACMLCKHQRSDLTTAAVLPTAAACERMQSIAAQSAGCSKFEARACGDAPARCASYRDTSRETHIDVHRTHTTDYL